MTLGLPYDLSATLMTLEITHFFLRPQLLLHAQIRPNIVADIMVGDIYIMMKEIETKMWKVIGNPRMLGAQISQ